MKPVTGPDGDNPISDEQIRELFDALFSDARSHGSQDLIASRIALRMRSPGRYWTIAEARTRCAEAWNARQGVR